MLQVFLKVTEENYEPTDEERRNKLNEMADGMSFFPTHPF